VDDIGLFYSAQHKSAGTHLALPWGGRVRFIVPRHNTARQACWGTFHLGRLEYFLRAITWLPRYFGAVCCVEDERLELIRETIGNDAGISCCRSGATGPWSKDTILFLHKKTVAPLCIVKAGAGDAVDLLLRNEANWLRTLQRQASLVDHIPELVAHQSGAYLSFVAELLLPGVIDFEFWDPHVSFLRKFQQHSRQTMRIEESRFYRNMRSRLKDLSGLLSNAWSNRLDTGMRQIEQSLSGAPILLVAAHNDFTPWNIRIEHGFARVFDWENADYEHLPLFDPLHFALMPMALKSRATAPMVRCIMQTLKKSQQWLGKEFCYNAQTQVLAYLMSICTLYLWSVRGASESHPVLDSYSRIIDHLCLP
jgi:hypothetical protein